jgi:hypothetical protein
MKTDGPGASCLSEYPPAPQSQLWTSHHDFTLNPLGGHRIPRIITGRRLGAVTVSGPIGCTPPPAPPYTPHHCTLHRSRPYSSAGPTPHPPPAPPNRPHRTAGSAARHTIQPCSALLGGTGGASGQSGTGGEHWPLAEPVDRERLGGSTGLGKDGARNTRGLNLAQMSTV